MSDSRNAALEAGTALFLRRGYAATGLKALLDVAGIPKGSFYHYFPSKRAFAVEAAERYFQAHLAAYGPRLRDGEDSASDRLRAYFEELADSYAAQGFVDGCLLGGLAQEAAGEDEEFARTLDTLFDRWRGLLAEVIGEGQATGHLDARVPADTLASYVLSAWEGALVQMRASRSRAPLDAFLTTTFDVLLRA